jgi:glucokinase
MSAACVAVAGPVHNGRTEAINLRWPVDAGAVTAALAVRDVALVNDLETNARGITLLDQRDLTVINAGRPAAGNRAVVSAGTGLGEAALWWDGSR